MAAKEETIALAYLRRAGDQKNKCMLTSERLMLVYKGHFYSFDRPHIKAIYFSRRRLLLPLVSGGIIAPLSLLAIFLNLYNLLPLLFIFFIGLLLFYLGVQQHPVLTVKDSVKEHDFFLEEITPNLKAFVSFARQVIFSGHSLLYLPIRAEEWEKKADHDEILTYELQQQGYIRLLNEQQIARWDKPVDDNSPWLILHIDLLRAGDSIRYEDEGSGELYAHLYQPLNRRAVVHVGH
ncbi:MAG: DUF952 domain-containing protein [Cyclobacteriaceae bacterium]